MLDTERRRLLHTNGKGGLVYESEFSLERLKSEHKGAIIFENECIKNLDELERVELALAKARDEHEVAQRMCDVHDDVLRLQKFDRVRELKDEENQLRARMWELDAGAGFDVLRASYESLAQIRSTRDSLERDSAAFDSAQNEKNSAEEALLGIVTKNSEGLSELIDEYGAPSAAMAYFSAKKKKKSSAVFMIAAFGTACAIMLAFAAALAFAMSNVQGGATVAFIGILLAAVAIVFSKKLSSAKAELSVFLSKMGGEYGEKDEQKILASLEAFYENIGVKAKLQNTLEGAKFRFSMAQDALSSTVSSARGLVISLGVSCEDGKEAEALASLEEKMRNYLSERGELEERSRECSALLRSLSSELERFNENDILSLIHI